MINYRSHGGRPLICNATISNVSIRNGWLSYAIGVFIALLAWCPVGRAQAQSSAPASAEEVKQLREVVQSLLTRVTELETELKQGQKSSPERAENSLAVSTPANANVAAAATTIPVAPLTQTTSSVAPEEHLIAGDRAILDY